MTQTASAVAPDKRWIRLPLQVGTSSVWSFARFAAVLIPGLLILAYLPVLFLTMGGFSAFEDNIELPLGILLGLGALGLGLSVYALKHLWLAISLRPCDVLVSGQGLWVEGGPNRSVPIAWHDIDPKGCQITQETVTRLTAAYIVLGSLSLLLSLIARDTINFAPDPKVKVWRLRINVRGKGQLLIAEAESSIEKESLEALRDCARAMCAPKGKSIPPKAHNVLSCRSCGGPVAAVDAERVPCAYCGAEVAIPADIRERVRASDVVRASQAAAETHVKRLIDQPGAHATNLTFMFAAIPMALAWPIAVLVAVLQFRHDAISFAGTLQLVIFPIAVVLAAVILLRARLTNRVALRLLTLGFAAKNPEKAGEPYLCRKCGGALGAEPNQVVSRCIYCGSDNVLGIDLRHKAGTHKEEAKSLEEALTKRSQQRLIWFSLVPVAGLMIVVGAWTLKRAWDVTRDEAISPNAAPALSQSSDPMQPMVPTEP